jgi:hypothetical protein
MATKCIEELVTSEMQILPANFKQLATTPSFIGRPQALVDAQDHGVAVHRPPHQETTSSPGGAEFEPDAEVGVSPGVLA